MTEAVEERDMLQDTKDFYKSQINQFFTIEEKKARIKKNVEEAEITLAALKLIQEELENDE